MITFRVSRVSLRELLAVAALAALKIAQGPQEVDLAQIRAEGLHKIEFRVRRLPQHEIAQPLLPRGADDQIGIGLATGVQMLTDEFGGELIGEFLNRTTRVRMLLHDRPHRIHDLAAPTIPDC